MPSFTGRCRVWGLASEAELIVILGLMLVGQARHRQHVIAPAHVVRRKNHRRCGASGGALARKTCEAEPHEKACKAWRAVRSASALSAGILVVSIYSLACHAGEEAATTGYDEACRGCRRILGGGRPHRTYGAGGWETSGRRRFFSINSPPTAPAV